MKYIQALVENGWILTVRSDRSIFGPSFVAQVDDTNPQMDVTSGHAHIGRTVETALLQLDDFVAAQGKSDPCPECDARGGQHYSKCARRSDE